MTESEKKESRRRLQGIVREMKKRWGELPEPDYSLPAFNDPARLREFMNVLGLNQSDLAREAGVSQSFISALVAGREKFSEPSRTNIWRAINRLQLAKIERDIKEKIDRGSVDPVASPGLGLGHALEFFGKDDVFLQGLFKTPMERKEEEIALLKQERDLIRKDHDLLQKLVDMNLVDRCVELEKQLAAALQANADYVKLFGLKGAAVAGDELQEQIEERQQRKGPEK